MFYSDYVSLVMDRLNELHHILEKTMQSPRSVKELNHLIEQNELMLIALELVGTGQKIRYVKRREDMEKNSLDSQNYLREIGLLTPHQA